jgi:AraC family transcriptional regulator of adaptative response / DNA-3-methyladenine glycosylase II
MVQTPSAAVRSLPLRVVGPFDSAPLFSFLAARTITQTERVERVETGWTYARTLRLAHGPGWIHLAMAASGDVTTLRVATLDSRDLDEAVERARWLLDLDTDMAVVDRFIGADPALAASVGRHPGLRAPGQVDGFEVAVRAVVGQQISVAGARTVLARITAEYGEDLDPALVDHSEAPSGLCRLFPTPAALADVDPASLPMPRARGRCLVGLACSVATGELRLDRLGLRADDRSALRRQLLALPGVGPWTADYIALRALGDPDVFLTTDLGVRHGLARLGLDHRHDVSDRWAPWRSYAMMHVWQALADVPA